MKPITDRIKLVLLGLVVIVAGLISPRMCREAILQLEEPEDPVETRRRHREMFLKQHLEMTGE